MNPTVKNIVMALRNKARRGVAAVEFALTLPIWLALLLGIADGSYYLLVNEKVDRVSYTVTDIVTQYQSISIANLKDIMAGAEQLMRPFGLNPATIDAAHPARGYVLVSSVFKATGSVPVIKWQYSYPPSGAGVTIPGSKIGTVGGTASLPHGLVLNDNDNVIITEVYYNFTPLFLYPLLDTFVAQTIYRVSVYKPRLSPLVTPPT